MIRDLLEKKEKKVEYVELIFDLVFVYLLGRNNSLLHHVADGKLDWEIFLIYLIATLAVIQIWNYTTYFVNLYGRHSIRDHVFLFVTMFLLYYMAEGTREHWQELHTQYHAAWALVLLSLGFQHFLELLSRGKDDEHAPLLRGVTLVLCIQALLAAGAIWERRLLGSTWLSLAAVVFGLAAMAFVGNKWGNGSVDFPHLSERAMLYVVFTFGEMIIAVAGYFEGTFSFRSLYFSAMAFLIVVGLFLSYGVVYDHLTNRELQTGGLAYMFLHLFLILALSGLTNALELMQDEAVPLVPKLIFLLASFLTYYGFLLGTLRYAKPALRPGRGFALLAAGICAVFVGLMVLLRENMAANIAVSAAFTFAQAFLLYGFWRIREKGPAEPNGFVELE